MRVARIARRVAATLVLMLATATFVFILMRAIPGDPVDAILGREGTVNPTQVALIREQFQLDRPLPEQLAAFYSRLLRGDLGTSIIRQQPVTELIAGRLPATIELAVGALLFALVVALPVGVISAVRQRSAVDRGSMAAAFVGMSMPPFWLGIILILLFAVRLQVFPVAGRITYGYAPMEITGLYTVDALLTLHGAALADALRHLALPAVTLGAVLAALIARVSRSSMVEVLREEYVRTARAKGLAERVVIVRHALRNALIPLVTVIGLEVGALLGGNMIVETVFEWPGIGRLAIEAIFARDYPVVQGVVIVYAFTFAVANLLVDVVYTFVNPRLDL
ncbi:MAG: ABC transporter permease [Candidatus Limnocylindria bacterium]